MKNTFPSIQAELIKLVICDVDGVLTPPKILITSSGDVLKEFNVTDGLGLQLLMSSGVELAVISGRQSLAVKKRTRELGIKHVYQGVADKLPIYSKLIAKLNLRDKQVAYVGDDYPDLPIMKRCGLSITVPHATDLIKTNADYTTGRPGGDGAVREVCELIMIAQGTLGKQTGKYLK